MPLRRQRSTRSSHPAGAGRAAPKPQRRSGAATTPIRLVTPTDSIDLAWPQPATKDLGRLQHQAIEWTHIVRNRTRWIGTPELADQQDARARELLKLLGVTEAHRQHLAEAGTVRVSLPYKEEQVGWEARILPWEFVLSAATRDLRSWPLVVTRQLLLRDAPRAADYSKVLLVESAPGALAQDWDFEDERRLVYSYTKPVSFETLLSPTRENLAAAIDRIRPGIVHLAGFDSHQGLELLKASSADKVGDGYLLASSTGVDPISATDLAATVTMGSFAPALVFCNIWNSAARIAPLLVAGGVGAAIGFQDAMDDALAEMFLGTFYREFSDTGDLDDAFQGAWRSLREQPKPLRGSGIVLWRAGSLHKVRGLVSQTPPAPPLPKRLYSPEDLASDKAREYLAVTVKPEAQFSYGLLHNNRDLFRTFVVRNLSDGRIAGLDVFVELHSNEGTYPYRATFSIDGPVLDLSPLVRIALTSQLARTLDEVLRTSLYVQVKWGTHEIFRETFPVTMAPVDQWADTDADRIFLPSFVFPRDRAVAAVIRNAEHYVTALRDDPTAGFDGYQSIDPELANPAENVDRQVQALWYSVVYRVPASYINPPPTYAVSSQRIRTPSEIAGGGFGTCIDLALMFASCLEAIEIYPVIFVLEDHAFPGYWRTEKALAAFRRRVAESAPPTGSVSNAIRGVGASARHRPGASWCFDASALPHIKRAIDRNQLVPLESVGLTRRSSFADAADEGRTYFDEENVGRFLQMLDVMTARERGVTPLPLGPRLQGPPDVVTSVRPRD